MSKGSELEGRIMAAAKELESRGVLRLHKWPVPMRVEPRGHQCPTCQAWSTADKVLWCGQTGSDFFGVTSSGRGVVIEAKKIGRPRLPLGVSSGDGIKKHQLLELLDWHRAGALALVIWQRESAIAVFDPDVFMPKDRMIPKSISWEALPAHLKKGEDTPLEEFFEPFLSVRRLSQPVF